jgi:hypothetical protein
VIGSTKPARVTYRKAKPPGASNYVVIHEGESIGTVGRFAMGAGQFGSTWMATTPSRRKSTRFTTRDSAAAWLVKQARG